MSIFVDILQGGVNSHGVTVDDFNAWATEGFLNDGITPKGIIGTGTPLTGDYAVQAQAVPNMTLNVLPGVALVTGTPTGGVSQRLVVRSTTNQVITIASNSTGGTRHDWVYIRLDANKMRDPNVPASDVADIFVSRSTSSSVDNGTPPAFGHLIAIVAVANAASSITNANITNRRVMASNIVDNSITTPKIANGAVTMPKIHNPFKFQAFTLGIHIIPDGAWTRAHLDSDVVDTNNNYDPTIARYTVPVNGFYYLYYGLHGRSNANQGAIMNVEFRVNGTSRTEGYSTVYPTASNNFIQLTANGSALFWLTAGQTVELWVLINALSGQVNLLPQSGWGGFLVSVT